MINPADYMWFCVVTGREIPTHATSVPPHPRHYEQSFGRMEGVGVLGVDMQKGWGGGSKPQLWISRINEFELGSRRQSPISMSFIHKSNRSRAEADMSMEFVLDLNTWHHYGCSAVVVHCR